MTFLGLDTSIVSAGGHTKNFFVSFSQFDEKLLDGVLERDKRSFILWYSFYFTWKRANETSIVQLEKIVIFPYLKPCIIYIYLGTMKNLIKKCLSLLHLTLFDTRDHSLSSLEWHDVEI